MALLELPSRAVLVQRGPSVGYVGPSLASVRLPRGSKAQGYVLLHRASHGAWQTFRMSARMVDTAKRVAARVARKTRRKVILGELVEIDGPTQVIRAISSYEVISKAELLARATKAAGNVARLMKAKEPDPYKPREFDRLVDDLARDLNKKAVPEFRRTVEAAVTSSKIDWSKATEKQLDAFSRTLATRLGVSATKVWKSVKTRVVDASVSMATDARSAFVNKHELKVDRAIALEDKAAVTRSAMTNAHYVREFATGQMSPSLSSQARTIVQKGISKGESSRMIGKELHRVLGSAAEGQTEAYFRMAASAINARSREFSSLRSMQDAGVEKYEWSSVLDESTTETCFAAGTKIKTPAGEVPIEQISPGSEVITGLGLVCRVRGVLVRRAPQWVQVRLSSGRHLTVTENHPILSVDGWIRAHELRPYTEVATGKMRELPEGLHVKMADQCEGVGSVLFPRMLLETGAGSQSERNYVCWMRGALCFSKTHEGGLDEVLLAGMLSHDQEERCLGGSRLRALWYQLQGSARLRGKRAVSILQQHMSSKGEQARRRPSAFKEGLRDMWPGFYHISSRVSQWEGQAPLFQEVLTSSDSDDVRAMPSRIRGQEQQGAKKEILLQAMLSNVPGGNSSCDVDRGDFEGLRHTLRSRGAVRRSFGSAPDSERRFLDAGSWRCFGIRRRLLARREEECCSRGAQGALGQGGRAESCPCSLCRHRTEPREVPVEDYLASRSGFVTVESVTPIDGPVFCYNLEVDQDPTYIAEGVIVHNCRFLDGQVFTVQGALDRYAAADALEDPTDVKYEMPWFYEKTIRGGTHDGKRGIFMNQRGGMQRVAVVEKAGFGQRDTIGTYSNTKSVRSLERMGMPACPAHGN